MIYVKEDLSDFSILKKEVLDLVSKIPLEKNQISCQYPKNKDPDWYSSVGRLEQLEEKQETKYDQIHPELRGSMIEKIIERYKGYRARIMVMPPRQTYSIHADLTPRLHIPIDTNDQCWMIWPYDSKCVRLAEGKVYWTDTRKHHTAINGHETKTRIHLVICVAE